MTEYRGREDSIAKADANEMVGMVFAQASGRDSDERLKSETSDRDRGGKLCRAGKQAGGHLRLMMPPFDIITIEAG